MRASLWLVWREIVTRRHSLAISVAALSVAVALCSATELISRAREVAVASKIAFKGPALRIIPAGLNHIDLARFELGTVYLAEDSIKELRQELLPWLRAAEGRLLTMAPLDGRMAPAIGIEPSEVVSPFNLLKRLKVVEVALGSELAEQLGKRDGDVIQVMNDVFRIAGVLPSTGTPEDLALFLDVKILRQISGIPGINEIRIFTKPGIAAFEPAELLQARHKDLSVIIAKSGIGTDAQVYSSLRHHRWVLYLITATLAGLCVLLWSHLNSSERRVEISTIVAIGGTSSTVLVMLSLRSVIVGLLGSLVGCALGVLIVLLQDVESASSIIWSIDLFFAILASVLILSITGALPVSVLSAFREHVSALQEQ